MLTVEFHDVIVWFSSLSRFAGARKRVKCGVMLLDFMSLMSCSAVFLQWHITCNRIGLSLSLDGSNAFVRRLLCLFCSLKAVYCKTQWS